MNVRAPVIEQVLHQIRDEMVLLRQATERIATALETSPEQEPTSIEWHTDVPEEEN